MMKHSSAETARREERWLPSPEPGSENSRAS
jgi:hypothetical protein